MKFGIVSCSNDKESVWNSARFGAFAYKKGDDVCIILLSKGINARQLGSRQFNVTEQMTTFVDGGSEILAFGTCLKLRHNDGSEMCLLSTLKDLHRIVSESDRIVTF